MKKIAILIAVCLGIFVFAPTTIVIAETPQESVCKGVGFTGGSCDNDATSNSVQDVVELVVNTLSIIIGVASVVMIIIGGFKYITAAGDSNSINSAKNTILYAIIGLVVAALAQVIVQVVLRETEKVTYQHRELRMVIHPEDVS